jgi:hypothetical protein
MYVQSQKGRGRGAAPALISLSLCLLRLQQLRPKLDGDGELVATNAGVGEG